VGKSFVFSKLTELASRKEQTVRGFAPTHSAVRSLALAGVPTTTVQSFLLSPLRPSSGNEIWLLDEATMLGAKDMRDFLKRAKLANARVILAGDSRQFGSVTAGRIFKQLTEYGLCTVVLDRVVRQDKASLAVKLAVDEASEGQVQKAIRRLKKAGLFFSSEDSSKRLSKVAELYTTLPGETLVVCSTNQERHELNRAIRSARKEQGIVCGKEITTDVYLKKSVTRAQTKEARHYERGDVLSFRHVQDERLTPGVWYEVAGRDLLRNLLTVITPDGRTVTFSPHQHCAIKESCAVQTRHFAVGDRLELRGTDRSLNLFSGQAGTVVSLDKRGTITLETTSGELTLVDLARYKTLDYAYATTGHSAQSKTVDNAIVYLTSRHREEVLNRASFYVGTSRTRNGLYFVTDDEEMVTMALGREHRKPAALDIISQRGLDRGLGLSLSPSASQSLGGE
jgi:ATP-dependent exoDNAse (exonuclease V) alpha subunit